MCYSGHLLLPNKLPQTIVVKQDSVCSTSAIWEGSVRTVSLSGVLRRRGQNPWKVPSLACLVVRDPRAGSETPVWLFSWLLGFLQAWRLGGGERARRKLLPLSQFSRTDKFPQVGGLRQQKSMLSQSGGLQVQNQGVSKTSKAPAEDPSLPLVASGVCWQSLTFPDLQT